MDDNLKRIRDFKKYLPFIEYRLSQKIKCQSKFELIKHWIETETTRLMDDVLDNIERALASQYRKAIIAGYDVPKEFACLFKKNERLEGTVDLCSESEDDEVFIVEENLFLSSDELNMIMKQKNTNSKANEPSTLHKSTVSKNNVKDADIAKTVICLDSESEDEETTNNSRIKSPVEKKQEIDQENVIKASVQETTNNSRIKSPVEKKQDKDQENVITASVINNKNNVAPTTDVNNKPEDIGLSDEDLIMYENLCNNVGEEEENSSKDEDISNLLYYRREHINKLNQSKETVNTGVPKTVIENIQDQIRNTANVMPPTMPPTQQHSFPTPKLNLKDPRIARKLEALGNVIKGCHPEQFLSALNNVHNWTKMATDSTEAQPCPQKPHPATEPKRYEAKTYREHLELKKKEAELKKLQNTELNKTKTIEANKQTKNISKIVKTSTAENSKSTTPDKPNNDICSAKNQQTVKPQVKEQSKENAKENQSQVNSKDRNNEKKTNNTLKGLHCSFIGFSELQDYIPAHDGKRQSSVKARTTIAEQLRQTDKRSAFTEDDVFSKESESVLKSDSLKKSDNPLKRRRAKSVCENDAINAKRNHRNSEEIELNKISKEKSKSLSENSTSNIMACLRPCFVKLERLPNEMYYLSKQRQALREDDNMMELDIGRIEEEPAENTNTQAHNGFTVANTDATMTEDTTKFCALCKSKPRNLTQHYVRVHFSESYVSRLSEYHLNYLSENIPYAVPFRYYGSVLHYKVECGFGTCHEEICKPFDKLFDHYAKHTGEYAYQCSKCAEIFVDQTDICRHRSKNKECKRKRSLTLYQYPKNLKTIYLYYCKLCNFAQLNLANTYKHLRDHHLKRGDDPAYIDKTILCTIDFEKNLDSDLDELNVCVNNEPLVDEDALAENEDDNDNIIEENQAIIKSEMPNANSSISELFANDDTDLQTNNEPFVKIAYHEHTKHLDQHKPLHLKEELVFSNKAQSTYRIYDNMQFGLFKCMAVDCDFTTNIDDEMLKHLNDHFNSLDPPHGCLNCAYCQLDNDPIITTVELVEHVRKNHGSSKYQCHVCCYRSCSPENVAIHFQTCHANSSNSDIVECDGTTMEKSERMPHMVRCMMQNVKRLNCTFCPAAYFAVSSMEEHYNIEHQDLNTTKPQFKMFACIYCNDAKFNKIKMQQHNALNHPDEFNFACLRRFRVENSTDDTIENICLIDITAIDIRMGVNMATNVVLEKEKSNALLQIPMKDEKPSTEELYMRQREIVKASLKKLTADTGIPPDQLYICPESNCCAMLSNTEAWINHLYKDHEYIIYPCPHCKNTYTDKIELAQHFLAHLRHTFVCFHCGETFAEEKCIREHFSLKHHDIEDQLRLEHVQFNRKYAYLIGMATEPYEDNFSMLCDIQEMLLRRMEQLKELTDNELHTKWNIPLQDNNLDDIFILDPDMLTTAVQCLAPDCYYKSRSVTDLKKHMTEHNIMDRAITCIDCKLKFAGEKNFECFLRHLQNKHISTIIHVCCLCSYKCGTRKALFKHILAEHNKRDAFELLLTRNTKSKAIGLGVWFAVGFKTFTSTKNCFCCKQTDIEALAIHLREEHQISLAYFCAYCNERLTNLQLSDDHFKKQHENMQLKLFAVLQSKNLITVKAVNPLIALVESQTQTNRIKEIDADILAIYEGDDLIIADEVKRANEEQAQNKGKISFVNVSKLMADKQYQNNQQQNMQQPRFIAQRLPQQYPPLIPLNNQTNNNNISGSFNTNPTFQYNCLLENGKSMRVSTQQPIFNTNMSQSSFQAANLSQTIRPTTQSGNYTQPGNFGCRPITNPNINIIPNNIRIVPGISEKNVVIAQALNLMERYPQVNFSVKLPDGSIVRNTTMRYQTPTNLVPRPGQAPTHSFQPNNRFNYNLLNKPPPMGSRHPQL